MPESDKPHILFIGEKWCDSNPSIGISNSQHSFWGTLKSNSNVTFELFHFDEYYEQNRSVADAALIKTCIERKPDLIFITWMFLPELKLNPQPDTLFTIRHELGIPIFTWWGDSHLDDVMEWAKLISDYVDFTWVGDSATSYKRHKLGNDKCVPFPIPTDPAIFNDAGLNRDIDVSFVGSIDRDERKQTIEHLRNNGINVYQIGGQREGNIPILEYAKILQRSKITLNITKNPFNAVNGRLFEATLCGACLFEPVWSEASYWYSPGKDYIAYDSLDDLLKKVNYYLQHDSERIAIAKNGHEKAHKSYTGPVFWEMVLQKLKQCSPPNTSAALCAMAEVRCNRQNYNEAMYFAYEAIKENKGFSRAYNVLSQILYKMGNRETAFNLVSEFVKDNQDDGMAHALFARALVECNQKEKAAQECAKALNIAIDNLEVVEIVADALLKIGHFAQAVKLYDSLYQLQGLGVANLVKYIEALVYAGELQKASQVMANIPADNIYSNQVHEGLAELLTKIGDKSAAAIHKWMSMRPFNLDDGAIKRKVLFAEFKGLRTEAQNLVNNFNYFFSNEKIKTYLEDLFLARGGVS